MPTSLVTWKNDGLGKKASVARIKITTNVVPTNESSTRRTAVWAWLNEGGGTVERGRRKVKGKNGVAMTMIRPERRVLGVGGRKK